MRSAGSHSYHAELACPPEAPVLKHGPPMTALRWRPVEEVSLLEAMPFKDSGLVPSSVLSFLCVTSSSAHHTVLSITVCLNTGQKATEERKKTRLPGAWKPTPHQFTFAKSTGTSGRACG